MEIETRENLQYTPHLRRSESHEKQSNAEDSPPDEWAAVNSSRKPTLPIGWRIVILILTCLASFGNHWSNGLIVALKTTIIKEVHINNSQFATLVACTNLVNTFLCVSFGFCIDKWGGPLLTVIMALFHLSGSIVMAGSATNGFNNYPLLIVGKVLAAIGDGSLDNAQHRIFSTYFARGRGFAFSIGAIWGVANLAQFTGQSTANVIATNLGTYAWALWISAIISLFSVFCAGAVYFLDLWLLSKYEVTDHTDGMTLQRHARKGVFSLKAVKELPVAFWLVVLFSIFENAGVQSFVSISTQFAQQRLKKGAVIGGWVSSFYLLLPACLTPFLGVIIDLHGQRVTLLFASAVTFLISMLLLKFSHSVPTFVAAYVFYALAQCVTPAPQVEIIRSIIADPRWFATAFAIKKSVVQASIVIITTAAGKLQDDTLKASLDPAVTLWLIYAFLSVAVSGGLLVVANWFGRLLPSARLSQVKPSNLGREVRKLLDDRKIQFDGKAEDSSSEDEEKTLLEQEKVLKKAERGIMLDDMRWIFLVASAGVIAIGWIMFGLGVAWGVHGSVIAGTTGE